VRKLLVPVDRTGRRQFCPHDGSLIYESEVSAGIADWDACKWCYPAKMSMDRICVYVKKKKECSADEVYNDLGILIALQVEGFGSFGRNYPNVELYKAPSPWGHERYRWRVRSNGDDTS
jgi:hypothetical protein